MSRQRMDRLVDSVFQGDVASWIYPALRVALAAIVLVRHSDVLSPLVFLQHHLWVKGLDFTWSVAAEPALVSPLLPGFALSQPVNDALVLARTVLAVLLLVGIRSRPVALLLAMTGYALLLADRHRFFHHLHLLYVSLAFLSLCPLDCRFSLERAVTRLLRSDQTRAPTLAPVWPLQLLRGCLVGVYLGAAISKVEPTWLRGDTLSVLQDVNILRGPIWRALSDKFGAPGLAWLTLAGELLIPLMLVTTATRRLGVAAGLAFHTLLGISVMVSTFGVQMAVLLLTFLVPRAGPPRTLAPR